MPQPVCRTGRARFVGLVLPQLSGSVHPAELVLRGTLMYWFLLLLLRLVMRRDIGSVGVADRAEGRRREQELLALPSSGAA